MAVDRFLDCALSLAKPDWTIGQTKDMADMFRRFYNIGLDDAATKADSWASESGGGSGSEGYKNLAQVIRTMMSRS